MKKLFASACLILGNIVWFYAMKSYNDNRQVRLVSATLPSVVQLSAQGPIIKKIPYVKFKGNEVKEVGYHYKRTGFGALNRGSGVFVGDGLIMTCYHVTHGKPWLEVSLQGFDVPVSPHARVKHPKKVFAYLIGYDEDEDIALLRVVYPGQHFRGVKLRNSVQKGLPVLTIGFPDIFNKHVTVGIVSSFVNGVTFGDVVIEHGSSGGGLFDMDGKLCGLASYMKYPGGFPVFQGFSGFTNLDAMHKLMEKYEDF